MPSSCSHPHNVHGRVADRPGQQVLQQVARLDAPKLHVCEVAGCTKSQVTYSTQHICASLHLCGKYQAPAGTRQHRKHQAASLLAAHPPTHPLSCGSTIAFVQACATNQLAPAVPSDTISCPPTRIFVVPHQARAALLHKRARRALRKVPEPLQAGKEKNMLKTAQEHRASWACARKSTQTPASTQDKKHAGRHADNWRRTEKEGNGWGHRISAQAERALAKGLKHPAGVGKSSE